MDESTLAQLRLLKSLLNPIIATNSLLHNNSKLFEDQEILEHLLNVEKWSANINILISSYINLSKKYGVFTFISLKFSINCLLNIESSSWFTPYKVLEKFKTIVLQYLSRAKSTADITFHRLLDLQKVLFSGNSLFFQKSLVDLVILECFVATLGEYKGITYEECLKIVWVNDIDLESSCRVLNGLVIEEFNIEVQGKFNIVHYSESNYTSRYT
jgi:hypothetical protein